MTTIGLRRASCRPWLLQRSNVAIKDNHLPNEEVQFEFVAEGDSRLDWQYDIAKVVLVPGGRYLLTMAPTVVCLWDLGSWSASTSG